MVVLKGRGFILRSARLSDSECLFLAEQDREARRNFMTTPKSVNEVKRDMRSYLREANKSSPAKGVFVVEVDGVCAGSVWWRKDRDFFVANHKVSIGYVLHKEFRGKGIGSKAIRLLSDYLFRKYRFKRISATTRTFNIGSRKALEKAGFKLEGILRKNKCKNGKYLDDCVYAMIR